MKTSASIISAVLTLLILPRSLAAAPQVSEEPQRLTVTGRDYRAGFSRYTCQLQIELRDAQGRWHDVSQAKAPLEWAVAGEHGPHTTASSPARVRHTISGDAVVVGITTVLGEDPPTTATIDVICTDEGLLMRFVPAAGQGKKATCWVLPRIALDEKLLDAYGYWRPDDELRWGTIAGLGRPTTYAGVSAWGGAGDTAPRLSPRHPAVVVRSQSAQVALAAVLVDYDRSWARSAAFVQHHAVGHLYFYPGLLPASSDGDSHGAWGWLAPLPADPAAVAAGVERLLLAGQRLTAGFQSVAPAADETWTRPLPDFPAELRQPRPVDDIRQAVVYTINETINSRYGLDLARKSGSDMLIRGWFKWRNAVDYTKLAYMVPEAHGMGARFGGGITCSALYEGENGLSPQQVLEMATRGAQGQLIDAWKEAHCRHGTLSNPAYRDYLLSWCRQQIDAGADYLFMDEINAALQADEGFDDYSIADFRRFLLDLYGPQGWTPGDGRWRSELKIDLADRRIAPDGTLASFDYRAYLKALGVSDKPLAPANPLAGQWHVFRAARDDRAWKWLTDAIRAYAASKGRTVWISGNGLARYVDLQVLGVWDKWLVQNGRIDLGESQIGDWASTVAAGWGLAGKRVPVVLFHDWGFGGFPWMEISPDDRRLWIRVRGAEIYAAGGFFAFPVQGPQGDDARLDGTLAEVARQSVFYHRHRDLYLDAQLLGFEPLETDAPGLSLALWRRTTPPALILHAVNRQVQNAARVRCGSVSIRLPVDRLPRAVQVVSPDWTGEKRGQARLAGGRLAITLPELEAYCVAVLPYDALPPVTMAGRRITPAAQWARPERSEFLVDKDGLVRDVWALPGMLQGMLHQALRNPPTFIVNMPRGGRLQVHVRAVAQKGARLQWQVDGKIAKTVDLPDRDGRNDSSAKEYDATFDFPIPPGRHRLTLDNTGGDWARIAWYAFVGELE